MPELYECSNCFHSGPLDIHGGCERCGSRAVMSKEVMHSPYIQYLAWVCGASPALHYKGNTAP